MLTSVRQQLIENKAVFISCVVPIFNEEESIPLFFQALHAELTQRCQRFEIIAIDDGSRDKSLAVLKEIALRYSIKVISFSRNFGKEVALTAGLNHAIGDVVVILDADFQHPIELISIFLNYWGKGYDMVYGVRNDRKGESRIKRLFANVFYGLMTKISNITLPRNAGDFRLLDRKVVTALNTTQERARFMKGLYAWVGFKTIEVPFDVAERAAGKSSWHFRKLAELAVTGIISFTELPLRVWSFIGACISLISFIYAIYIMIDTLVTGISVPGYATIIVAIMFFGGIQLLSIGILGEYVARIFNEVKQRPQYIIAEKQGFDE